MQPTEPHMTPDDAPADPRTPPVESAAPIAPIAPISPAPLRAYVVPVRRVPAWLKSFLASNGREKLRLRAELSLIKGAIPLLMKPRNGGRWTLQERAELKRMLRSASAISPYLLIWALPGSIVFLPFLAWSLDVRRSNRARTMLPPPSV